MNKEEIIKKALIILHTTGYTNELEKSLCIDAIENLQQENEQLKEENERVREYYDTLSINGQILKDNWNKLKEELKDIDNFQRNVNGIPDTRMTPYNLILELMQELENGDSDED